MQFSLYTIAAAVASAGIASAAPSNLQARQGTTFTIKYDTVYDNAGQSMSTVSCSDGKNGLAWKWGTFGIVPHFGEASGGYGVAASGYVGGWNSDQCGKCYSINYGDRTAWVLAVDHAGSGLFNVGQGIMNYLTHDRAQEFGSIQAVVSEIDCGRAGWTH